MTTEDYVALFAGLFIGQLPTLVIASLGLWFTLSRERLPPRVARWAAWGFGLLIVHAFVSVTLRVILFGIQTNQLIEGGGDAAMSVAILNIWALAPYPLFIVGLAMLARGIFLDRDVKSAEPGPGQPVAGAA